MTQLPFEDLPEKPAKRATRLPVYWTAPIDLVDWCQMKLGMTLSQITLETEKFVDYWTAKPGKDGTKLDWPATFRNWCRRNYNGARPRPSGGHGPESLAIIAEHVKRPWYERGKYSRETLQACVDAGLITVEQMEEKL